MNDPILAKRLDLELFNKKKNLSLSGFSCSTKPQNENKNKTKPKDRQILISCQRAEKTLEHEDNGNTICCQCSWNSPQWLGKKTGGIGNQREN